MGQRGEMGRRGVAGGALPPGKTALAPQARILLPKRAQGARRPHFASLTHRHGGVGKPVTPFGVHSHDGALGSLARYLQIPGLRSLTPHGLPSTVPNPPLIGFRP